MISPDERPNVQGDGGIGDPPATRTGSDPRAARTRHAIFAAVTDLMAAHTPTVSVTDIVRTAGISRSSFYAHFTGIDELATEFLRMQLAEIASSGLELRREDLISGRSVARIGYSRLIGHLVDNHQLYASVLELPLTRGAYDTLIAVLAGHLSESVLKLGAVPSGVKPEVVATYVAGGAMTLMSSWIRGDTDVSDDELLEQLMGLLPPWLLEPGVASVT